MTIDWIQLLITVPLIVFWRLWQKSRSRPTLVGWLVCLVALIALNNYYAIGVAAVMAGFYYKHSAFVIPAVVAFSLTIRENSPSRISPYAAILTPRRTTLPCGSG
ncbi:MAG: hypothetical protein R3F31_26925 [Verrucomicrobiales bacterium]